VRLFKRIIYCLLALFLIIIAVFAYRVYLALYRPMIIEGQPIILEVKANSTANGLVQTLFTKNLIESRKIALNYIKYAHLANSLKAGVYQINPGESLRDLLKRIVEGDVIIESFRIIEGTTLTQVSNNLQSALYLNYDANAWQSIQGSYRSAEGLLLADTYHYNAGSDAKNILITANKKLTAYLESSWQNQDADLPYITPYDMLIAASIIEKEAAISSERKIIAGVVINRLRLHMPLQMDPTVIYALGNTFSGRLTHDDLNVDSPYNTYRYRGLPPTPIAMVGKDAIDAAAHPQKSKYLYYVAKGDGTHFFSENYTDQKKAISRYLHKDDS